MLESVDLDTLDANVRTECAGLAWVLRELADRREEISAADAIDALILLLGGADASPQHAGTAPRGLGCGRTLRGAS